ncbi:6-phosphogluconolactonase [Roseivirga ehrenbergii]|uniref:6-phosphogluconolactonase n=1 Tax=Roseivirga ehrenbergii (strain DSM 102268 / JCM 13514 / KCTC 12282 / NCIMB 14502 / KMM 6017) TaxID=279360 RepID=A0A150X6Y7_ROSEK|nr:6-phosphogluconolactonase [Roseivirga ehrenbergii]KYG74495.1 6-phosphogluconolactonase [Roseivirga ehrenbergii]TCL14198.1 6-phosphogluconolactonase [Roseivirga ehrenbergii]
MEIKTFKNPEATAKAFADYLSEIQQEVNRLNIALSGGSTPKLLFEILVHKYSDKIEWPKFHFYWGDERCVPPTSGESNYGMTHEYLFQHLDISEENIHRVFGECDPDEEAVRYGKLISENLPPINGLPQFDLIILGLGEDGHTASIFPHQMELITSKKVCEVAEHPTSGQKRITLTGSVINNAKEVCFLVTGQAKAEKVREILNLTGDCEHYPASYIKPTHGELSWFLDKAASGK